MVQFLIMFKEVKITNQVTAMLVYERPGALRTYGVCGCVCIPSIIITNYQSTRIIDQTKSDIMILVSQLLKTL